jgi:hypothetical protein
VPRAQASRERHDRADRRGYGLAAPHKTKLGLTVEATRIREVGPNKTGAKGSSTVFRITG